MTISSPRGQYRQVADVLRTRIENGTYARGSTLPGEEELAVDLGVSRSTVNRAIRILSAEGYVRTVAREGTVVTELPPIHRNAAARYSKVVRERAGAKGAFDAEIKALGLEPRVDLRVERVAPPAGAAEILGVSPDEVSTVVRARRMYAGETPVQLADSYIPLDVAAGTILEEQDEGPGGMVSRMAELGFRQDHITEEITARTPTEEEARFLRLTEDQRIYAVTHVGWTEEGRAVEVCLHRMPTHLWTLHYEFPNDVS
jgi:GntR family transcriptional regulator